MDKALLFEIFERVFQISEKMVRIDRTPHHFGIEEPLTRAEIHLVAAIDENPGSSVTNLARIKGVTKSAISQMLTRLEKKGLVEKRIDEQNSSRLLLSLTPKGRRASREHERVHENIYRLFVDKVGELDDQSLRFLQTFMARADEMLDEWNPWPG